ncbi:tail fiber assembly protein [Pseudomonas fluorescens]|nr:tail fiber assembly protein [Pseudomonas fluorescens]
MCTGLVVSIDGGFKVIPVPPEKPATPPESTLEELAAQAREKRDNLLSVAAIRIAPLQDAVDLGKANAAKKALLTKWKEYRVDLDDVPAQSGYPRSIQWPIEPS